MQMMRKSTLKNMNILSWGIWPTSFLLLGRPNLVWIQKDHCRLIVYMISESGHISNGFQRCFQTQLLFLNKILTRLFFDMFKNVKIVLILRLSVVFPEESYGIMPGSLKGFLSILEQFRATVLCNIHRMNPCHLWAWVIMVLLGCNFFEIKGDGLTWNWRFLIKILTKILN